MFYKNRPAHSKGAPKLALFATIAVAVSGLSSSGYAQAEDPKVILKSMSDYLKSTANISLSYDSDIEVVTPQMEKLEFSSSGTLLLNRPYKIFAARAGSSADVE